MRTIPPASRFVFIALVFVLLLGRAAPAQTATPGYALALDGSSGYVATSTSFNNPQTFTITIWFNTTTTQGGRLLGFGDRQTGASGNFDRQFYMDNNGYIVFGINPGSPQVISNTVPCNDGNWHQAVGTLSSSTGMSLYIDGELATNQPSFNVAQNFEGWWRIGYDSLNTWPDLPASDYFQGTIDEVQIWNTALNAAEIQTNLHIFLAGTEAGLVSYWQFNEGSGTTTADSSGNGNSANLIGGVTWVASTAPIGLPQATNQPASSVTAYAATLNGSVLPNYQQTVVWFQYGPTTNYGFTTPQISVAANNSSAVSVGQNIGLLSEGSFYHYQLVAMNTAGTNFGGDLTFSTLVAPGVSTLAATNITGSGVTLTSGVSPNGMDTTAWFEWGATTIYGNVTPATDVGGGPGTVMVSARIFGVLGGQAYHYHLVATNAFGKFIGVDRILEVPLIGLYGNNPLTNCFGVPFVDPGFLLAPTSPLAITASDEDELLESSGSISLVHDFSLVLKGDGTVVGWGDSLYGETNVPKGLSGVVAISAGNESSLALKTDGTVVAWGDNARGQASIPTGLADVVAIAAGDQFSLALQSSGTVVAWGDNTYGETNVPPGLGNVVAIAAGNGFCLALQNDGTVVAWGANPDGNTPPSGLSNVVAIAAGNGFSLALQSNGNIVGWGQDASSYQETPIPPGLTNVTAIAVGGYFSMALQSDGTIVGWGVNPEPAGSQGGWNIGENEIIRKLGLNETPIAIAAGDDFSLALESDSTIVGGGVDHKGNLDFPTGLSISSDTVAVSGAVNVNVQGVYTLTYTVTNFLGAVDTVTRTVVVSPPPPPAAFTITGLAQGQYALQFTGNTNAGYTVLATTNMAVPLEDWTVLGSAILTSNNLFQFIDTNSANVPDRFYMLRSP
jgi:Concanavalin A-like lectin/glucanases superfamily/Regulator of chromosome condensation (RCC1) repeat/Domain of unknown function (DUF5011)